MIAVRRAADRFETVQPRIRTRHCFSAGAHYDPDNVAFGPLIGVDEHVVQPGAGFDWHAHRGVVIVSVVLDGVLRHESGGTDRAVRPGEVLRQDATDGLRHRETNGGDGPLRFVQTTWLAGADVRCAVLHGPAALDGPAHLFVAQGAFEAEGIELREGDSVRAEESVTVVGSGELLVVRI